MRSQAFFCDCCGRACRSDDGFVVPKGWYQVRFSGDLYELCSAACVGRYVAAVEPQVVA